MSVNRVRRRGSYAPLSAHYYKDEAIIRAGERAELLYIRSLAFCADTLSDGWIARSQLSYLTVGLRNVPARVQALVACDLWTEGEDGWWVTSWLSWNSSRYEILGAEEKDRDRKKPQAKGSPPPSGDGEAKPSSERNPNGAPHPVPNGIHVDSDALARGGAPASSSSTSISTSTPNQGGGFRGEVTTREPDEKPTPPSNLDNQHPEQRCGERHSRKEACGECARRRTAEKSAVGVAQEAKKVSVLAAHRCEMCDGEERLLEVGRFLPVSPATRCDHKTDHATQVRRAREAS